LEVFISGPGLGKAGSGSQLDDTPPKSTLFIVVERYKVDSVICHLIFVMFIALYLSCLSTAYGN